MKLLLPLAITMLIAFFMCKYSPPTKRIENYGGVGCTACMI